MKNNLATYQLSEIKQSTLVAQIIEKINKAASSETYWLACINSHSHVTTFADPEYHEVLTKATWLIPDGVGITLAYRLLYKKNISRITGPDIFLDLNDNFGSTSKNRVFFIGSTKQTLSKIEQKFKKDYPNLNLVGLYSPPFKDFFDPSETDHMLKAINSARADIIWVGMTAPKQEKWIFENINLNNASFVGAVGAVFDFYAGNVKRPAPILRKLGLEWLGRLIQEPRRLWRRTFISGPLFVYACLVELVTNR